MELAQLERIFQRSAPRVWEFLAPVDDRIPQQFRPLVEQFLSRLYAGVAEWLTSDNQLSSDTSEELTALGLAMSRALAWDVIDEINKSWVQTVIESSVEIDDRSGNCRGQDCRRVGLGLSIIHGCLNAADVMPEVC